MLGLFKGKRKTENATSKVEATTVARRSELALPDFTVFTSELGDFFDFLTNEFPEVYYSWVYGEDDTEGVTLFTHVTLHGDFVNICKCSVAMKRQYIASYELNSKI